MTGHQLVDRVMRGSVLGLAAAAVWVSTFAGVGNATEPDPSPSAPHPLPGISIDIDNTGFEVENGDTAIYRITVRNDSDVDYPEALVSQMMPQALTFDQAQPAPIKHVENTLDGRTSEVQWVLRLPAHQQVSIDVRGDVGEPARGRVSLATTACVIADGVTRPMICDTDSDLIRSTGMSWASILSILGIAGLGAYGLHRWRRRRLAAMPS